MFILFFPLLSYVEMFVDVEFEQEEKEDWAKPLTQLWQCRPYNHEAEKEYNKSMGQQAPYCSICLIFHTHHQVRTKTFHVVIKLLLLFNNNFYSHPFQSVFIHSLSILAFTDVFFPPLKSESSSGSSSIKLLNRPGGRQWSKPLIPEMCFNTQTSKTNESEEGQLSNPHMREDGTSLLVSCAKCYVRVHTSKRRLIVFFGGGF